MGATTPRRRVPSDADAWSRLERAIVSCTRCKRLIAHCREVARRRRRAYRDEIYWGRPVTGFGDLDARILMLGLAPGAHGANRTGRIFTGDRSGDFLYGALHRAGLANQSRAVGVDDGLRLRRVFVSAACRCAPPGNRPSPAELRNCAGYLARELDLLARLRVVVALGRIAWEAALRRAREIAAGSPFRAPRFGHGAEARLTLATGGLPLWLVGSYHPSQQNTQTGRLTRAMFDRVIRRAVALARSDEYPGSRHETAPPVQ
ncbi:MAG TPA: uracil-DNA glycosylase [Candidatus Polarisedimenticolaceae bacterium]|nr:uracil-DNA glycosylase [Candidatus Polarisedimenticolaceae bacterium]